MSILSGPEIIRQVELGNIEIDPFLRENVGPNSIDVRLSSGLIQMDSQLLDMTREVEPEFVFNHIIPPKGFVLKQGIGYLGSIMERIKCNGFVPWIDGRSTTGRYFLQTHQTAGRGDDGWDGRFTIELLAAYRSVRVYAGLKICQVSFFKVEGERKPYQGRYQDQTGPRLPSPLPLPEYPR